MARARRGDGWLPVGVALVVLAVGMVASVALGSPPRSARGAPAARQFLDAWRRSRSGSFVVDATFSRTLPDGQVLRSEVRTVQDPPDTRLVSGLGSVSGRLAGGVVGCPATAALTPCVTGPSAAPYASEVDADIAELARQLEGDAPAYRVVAFTDTSDPCFRLDLARRIPSPPYGDHALFCFDRDTGAPSLTQIERPEAIDRTEATRIRAITPADLQIPVDRGAPVTVPGGPGASDEASSSSGG